MITGTMVPPPLDKIRAAVRAVCEARGVARVDLFGSVASGEAGIGSDVDLLVEFLPGSDIGLFEMGALKEDLKERLGCQVDLLCSAASRLSPETQALGCPIVALLRSPDSAGRGVSP